MAPPKIEKLEARPKESPAKRLSKKKIDALKVQIEAKKIAKQAPNAKPKSSILKTTGKVVAGTTIAAGVLAGAHKMGLIDATNLPGLKQIKRRKQEKQAKEFMEGAKKVGSYLGEKAQGVWEGAKGYWGSVKSALPKSDDADSASLDAASKLDK